MSRFTASLVLVASLFTGLASAETRFAAPPAAESAEIPVTPQPQDHPPKNPAALNANRRANLARFRAYYRAGKYPSNVYADGLTNVWRDEDGRLCAAATIMKASGEGALVEKIAEQNNFIKLADVTQGPVLDWILTSGFTQAELVAIQKPFQRVGQIELEEQDAQLKPIVVIDPKLRTDETVRLTKLYRRIDVRLTKSSTSSLDLAVERLMKRPDLARDLVN